VKLLLDQGLPHSTAAILREQGVNAIHTSERGLSTATDGEILAAARADAAIIVTLDSDFHTLLAIAGSDDPSVVRIRVEGLRASHMAALILDVITVCAEDLARGAAVSVREDRVRIHDLPIVR
jgi:predicted nuclease of predicted toxin-antitoxin system